jgi:hypothetical protein
VFGKNNGRSDNRTGQRASTCFIESCNAEGSTILSFALKLEGRLGVFRQNRFLNHTSALKVKKPGRNYLHG